MINDNIIDAFLNIIHDRYGVCGHCGKKKCQFKWEHSTIDESKKFELGEILEVLSLAIAKVLDGDQK